LFSNVGFFDIRIDKSRKGIATKQSEMVEPNEVPKKTAVLARGKRRGTGSRL
jgi:hypothetical protein